MLQTVLQSLQDGRLIYDLEKSGQMNTQCHFNHSIFGLLED